MPSYYTVLFCTTNYQTAGIAVYNQDGDIQRHSSERPSSYFSACIIQEGNWPEIPLWVLRRFGDGMEANSVGEWIREGMPSEELDLGEEPRIYPEMSPEDYEDEGPPVPLL